MLNPNSAHTRPEGENSKKQFQKNSKKIQKLKNNFPALFLAQPIPLILDPREKIPKKIAKQFKKLKK